jgi:hypothetical protein
MKLLITTLTLATLVAAPAFAASPAHNAANRSAADNAYAYASDSYTVVVDGNVVGRDPDANVRLQMRRDGVQPSNQ